MSELRETAYAKLNLALHVRGKLPDGRHRIETIFAFCEAGDELTARKNHHSGFELQTSGPFGEEIGPNIIYSAFLALKKQIGVDRWACLTLEKNLPVASGLGGGSADAAAALRLLSRLWDLDPILAEKVAPSLGSDVPACLRSWPSRGTGAGDELEQVNLSELKRKPVLLINPGVPLSTRNVFAEWDGVDRGPLGDWREGRNDLETPARVLVPAIGDVLDWLTSRSGASFTRMSGSGATCFALFESEEQRDDSANACPPEWWHLATFLR